MKKKYRILVLVATLFLGVLLTQSFNRANADDYPDIGTKKVSVLTGTTMNVSFLRTYQKVRRTFSRSCVVATKSI